MSFPGRIRTIYVKELIDILRAVLHGRDVKIESATKARRAAADKKTREVPQLRKRSTDGTTTRARLDEIVPTNPEDHETVPVDSPFDPDNEPTEEMKIE